jgi:17beta-estradiol 17-dehydrogenase / very-long-chain 3-oxoacyl-CoA reductase
MIFGDPYDLILWYLGIVVSGFFVLGYLRAWLRCFRRIFPLNLSKYGKGSWALVTGASDGIGRGFVEELVKAGMNVVMVARNK